MSLSDIRFLQKTQTLMLQYADGTRGEVQLARLNPQAQAISGIEPLSQTQIKLYFDGADAGILFNTDDLKGLFV